MRISDWSSDVCSSDLLFMDHRVIGDGLLEVGLLLLTRQLAVQQKIADVHEVALLGQFLDRITAVQQNALVAIDEGDLRFTGAGRRVARIVGEIARLSVQRSEEHTSELQSLMRNSYAVFCLKKKNTT